VVLLNLGQLLVGFAEIRIAGADMIEQALRNDSSPAAVRLMLSRSLFSRK
jgi:hypothetical protein